MYRFNMLSLFAFLPLFLFGCGASEQEIQKRVAQTQEAVAITWTQTAQVLATPTIVAIPTTLPIATAMAQPDVNLPPELWREWPVIPTTISDRMIAIYELGKMSGNDPHAFTKIGDCHSMPPEFFAVFETGNYDLGKYTYLQPTIDYFEGSFERQGRAAKLGLTATGVISVLWNDWKDCTPMETPLDCEYRINKSSFALISLGTNDANGVAPFETTLRRVIDVTIGHGVVPILATKADNAEGDHSINETIARLAYEYEIPMWNFWRAVQPLPDHGVILPDHREHLSYSGLVSTGDLRDEYLRYGYNTRNLTGLQTLDAVWRNITGQPLEVVPTTLP